MPTIKFQTKKEAEHYQKVCHSSEYAKKLRTIKSRYWSCDRWEWVPCYSVILVK